MTTWRPDKLGKPCPACGLKVPIALGMTHHPTCNPEFTHLIRARFDPQ